MKKLLIAAAVTSTLLVPLAAQAEKIGLAMAQQDTFLTILKNGTLEAGKARKEPVKADLYVQSEKLAKQAIFVTDNAKAPTQVTNMVLRDRLSNHKETRVRYVSRQTRAVPDAWLNPMFLARNPALE